MAEDPSNETAYSRDTPFSYKCNACSRCCYDKLIQVNPYEIARFASNLGIRPYEFIAGYLREDGPYLKAKPDGGCVLLGLRGCTVYGDRPLVCRIYPLGRTVQEDGRENFVKLDPHPDTEGEYGMEGTIGDFLEEQDTADHMLSVEIYHQLVNEVLDSIEGGDEPMTVNVETDWLDIEARDGRHFVGGPRKTPKECLNAMYRHVAALKRMVAGKSG